MGPVIKQFLNSLNYKDKPVDKSLNKSYNSSYIAYSGKVSTHNLAMRFKSFRSGNVIAGVFKSDILLIHKCFINEKKDGIP